MRRRLTLATISVLALIGGVAFGWIGAAAATGTPTFASHSEAAVFAHLAATLDAAPAALPAAAEVVASARDVHQRGQRAFDTLAAPTTAAALLLLLAAGLLLAVASAETRRAARLALGERAPPA